MREIGRWTSAGALTASVTAGAMVPLLGLARVRFCGDAVSGTCLSRDQRDYAARVLLHLWGLLSLQCEGALSRPMASIRARRRAMYVLHEVWALARLTRGSRGVGTGSGGATFRESDGIQKSILRGLAITQRTVRSTHSTRNEWSGWTTAVTQQDVDRVLRRVNRRIETGVVALPKGSRCLEDDHSWREADVELEPDFTAPCAAHQTTHPTARGTLVFLHGFGDDAKHWREFTELLVRGIPGGFDVVLPAAPNRKFQIAGEPLEATAWFEPRMKHTREGGWDYERDIPKDGSPWTCGGIDGAVAWTRRLVGGLQEGGAAPGSVLLAGFSQGAGLALAAAEDRRSWSPALGGVLSLRGYLPRRNNWGDEELWTGGAGSRAAGPGLKPPAVLMCHGGDDRVSPRRWAVEAVDRLRRGRSRYESDFDGWVDDQERTRGERVELMVSEGATHQLGPDDVWRARWWIRGMVEDSARRLPCHVPGMLV